MNKRTAYYGAMMAMAIICCYVEYLIPFNFGIPGIKLGLANIVALFLLYRDGFVSAITVNVARVLLCGILFGNAMGVFYSLVGGAFSVTSMWLLKKSRFFSTVGVSVLGGTAHNIGQLLAASVTIGVKAVIYYMPFLAVSGVITGFLIGIAASVIIKRVNRKAY